jgi:hypothetical protein
MTAIQLPQCPVCRASAVSVERRQGILVAECGCMLTELQVRRRAGASKKEVASL